MIKLTNIEGKPIYILAEDISVIYVNGYGETSIARHNEDSGWKVSEPPERVVELIESEKKVKGF